MAVASAGQHASRTSLQTGNHTSTSSLHIFYRLDDLPATQPTASKHWRQFVSIYYYYRFTTLCPGLPGWVGTTKVNHCEFCWSRDDGVVVASVEPYASYLHFAPEDNHASASSVRFLWAGCPSWHPTNSVKALKACPYNAYNIMCAYVRNLCGLDNQPKDAASWLQFQRHSHTSTTRICSECAAKWNYKQERYVFDPVLRPKVYLASYFYCFSNLACVFDLCPLFCRCNYFTQLSYFWSWFWLFPAKRNLHHVELFA